jgi:hypothetical protein
MRYDATRQCEPLSCGFFISARFGQANRDVVSVEMYYEYEDAQFSVSPLAFAHAVLSPGSKVQSSLLNGKTNGVVSGTS